MLIAVILSLAVMGRAAEEKDRADKPGKAAGGLSQKFLDARAAALKDLKGEAEVVFMGDSITAGWNRNGVKEIWVKNFSKYNPVNFGVPGYAATHLVDYTAHGGLAGLHPKAAVILIGVNDTNSLKETADEIVGNIKKIVGNLRGQFPNLKIIITAIFPRGPQAERKETWEDKGSKRMAIITAANKEIVKLDDGNTIRVLDLTEKFLVNGRPTTELQGDLLHLTPKGYQVWADGLTPLLAEVLK